MDIQEKRDVLEQLAKELNKHLPDWVLQVPSADDDTNRDRQFFRKGLMKFAISLDWQKSDRVNVSTWEWPKYVTMEKGEVKSQTVFPHNALYDPKEGSIDISVSIKRGPEAIAKDISRRFLPEYERIWARCAQIAYNHQVHADKTRATWEEACKLIGKSPNHNAWYSALGPLSLENRNGSLHVEGYITMPQLKVIHALMLGTTKGED